MVFIKYQYYSLLIYAIVKSHAQTAAPLYTLLSHLISSVFTIAYVIKKTFLSEYKLTKTCKYYKLVKYIVNFTSEDRPYSRDCLNN